MIFQVAQDPLKFGMPTLFVLKVFFFPQAGKRGFKHALESPSPVTYFSSFSPSLLPSTPTLRAVTQATTMMVMMIIDDGVVMMVVVVVVTTMMMMMTMTMMMVVMLLVSATTMVMMTRIRQ